MIKEKKIKRIHSSDKLIRWIGSPKSVVLHTLFFVIMLLLSFSSFGFDKITLVLTTIVSLEAIYLSIFIQMTVNKHGKELEEVSEDIDEIQEDIDEIQKDVDEIQEDVEDIEEEKQKVTFEKIEKNLQDLISEISELKKQKTN